MTLRPETPPPPAPPPTSGLPLRKGVRLASDGLMAALGQALVARGVASKAQINDLLNRKALTGEDLDRLIVKEGVAPERTVLEALSEVSGIPFLSLGDVTIREEAVARVPAKVANRYRVVPLTQKGGTLQVAASRVPDPVTADSLAMVLGATLSWVLAPSAEIAQSLKHFYGLGSENIGEIIQARGEEEEDEAARAVRGQDVSEDGADAGMIKFINQIILEAIRMEATDIHLEPFENRVRLRFRIDGVLQEIPLPENIQKLKRAIASCVKIMAQMDIAERRKPHDGRIKVRMNQEEFDLRVSVLPTRFGETVNMRILNRESMFIELDRLGLPENQLPAVKRLIALPHGILLLTGPTGSGKTTTLYATLSKLNNRENKIITVEDPVEYQMEGINQIQVHSQIGLTFSACLRSILRHDPDIILIGEIRDQETADIAVQASLTGHLVFSTLHTNDAPSAVTRLTDMGVEPYLVSSCIEGIIAQRLVRRVCKACKQEVEIEPVLLDEAKAVVPDHPGDYTFWAGHTCPACNFTGYRGRIAIIETLVLDDELRSLIVQGRPSNELKRLAVEDKGMVTLRECGWMTALRGVTSAEEVVRVARKTDYRRKPGVLMGV